MSVAGLERMTTGSVASALSYRATQVDLNVIIIYVLLLLVLLLDVRVYICTLIIAYMYNSSVL